MATWMSKDLPLGAAMMTVASGARLRSGSARAYVGVFGEWCLWLRRAGGTCDLTAARMETKAGENGVDVGMCQELAA